MRPLFGAAFFIGLGNMALSTIQKIDRLGVDSDLMHEIVHGSESESVPTEGGPVMTVAAAIKSIKTFTIRGAWATGTQYEFKDLYVDGGVVYMVLQAHVSTTVAADIASGLVAIYQDGPFMQDGAGAVLRTHEDKDRDIISVKDFGAKGDGANADAPFIVACAVTTTGDIYFPTGDYVCTPDILQYSSRFVGSGLLHIGTDILPAGRFAAASFTLSVPGNFSDPNAALAFLENRQLAEGITATIKVADGAYAWAEISPSHPQGQQINVIGNQANPGNVVYTYDATNAKNGFHATGNYALGLVDGITVQSNAWESHGTWNMAIKPLGSAFAAWNGGFLYVGPNVHVTKCYYGIRAINGGNILVAPGAQVSECGDVGIHAFGGSIWCDGTSAFNCADTGPDGPVGTGYLSENGGSLHSEQCTTYGNRMHGFAAYSNGATWAFSSSAYNNGSNGFFAYTGGHVIADQNLGEAQSTSYGNGQFGVRAESGGSVEFQNGLSYNNGSDGVSANSGTIFALGVSSHNNGGLGFSANARGVIDASNSTADSNGAGGYYSTENSSININSSSATNNTGDGYQAGTGGHLQGTTVNSYNNTKNGISSVFGASVNVTTGTVNGNHKQAIAVTDGSSFLGSGITLNSNALGVFITNSSTMNCTNLAINGTTSGHGLAVEAVSSFAGSGLSVNGSPGWGIFAETGSIVNAPGAGGTGNVSGFSSPPANGGAGNNGAYVFS